MVPFLKTAFLKNQKSYFFIFYIFPMALQSNFPIQAVNCVDPLEKDEFLSHTF